MEGRIVSVLVSHLPRLNCLPLVLSVSLMHSLLSFRQNAKKLNQQANTALLQMQLYQCWSCLAASQECSASLCCSGLGGAKMYSRWIQFLGCLFPQKLSVWIQTVICQWKLELWWKCGVYLAHSGNENPVVRLLMMMYRKQRHKQMWEYW